MEITKIKIKNKYYFLDGWNGEFYCNCWSEEENDKNTYTIKPIYKYLEELEQYEEIDYEIIWID